jgi:adenosylcobinamide-GDP ribazoletransferase
MNLYAALLFLTRIPFPQIPLDDKKISGSVVFFPVAGALIGSILYGIFSLTSRVFSMQASMAFVLLTYLILTGGMHVDGFADTLDGFFCGGDKQKKLDVMKDSCIGTFGSVGITILLILKWSLLSSLNEKIIMSALLTCPVISRWVMTIAVIYFPYIRPTGLGKSFEANSNYKRAFFSTLLTFALVYFMASFHGLYICLLVLIVGLVFIWYSIKQLGGLTGDIYGAINEISDVLALMLFSII